MTDELQTKNDTVKTEVTWKRIDNLDEFKKTQLAKDSRFDLLVKFYNPRTDVFEYTRYPECWITEGKEIKNSDGPIFYKVRPFAYAEDQDWNKIAQQFLGGTTND